jgi:crotonobetainyl-CoA:carnitine CoA-transferase CaiB-like acyl-CoA transferase
MSNTPLALEGLRIVEYGSFVAGPYCSKLLADAGAEVVKVEPPEGEELRKASYSLAEGENQSRAGIFSFLNTNKWGVTLDLLSKHGRDRFEDLLSNADVLIWNGTPEIGNRLRLRYRHLASINPRLIVTAITPFGLTGPYSKFKGNELVVYNLGGLGYASPGLPDHVDNPPLEPPLHPRAPIAQIISGLVAATATMMAIAARNLDGKGREVDIGSMESVASMVGRDTSIYSYIQEVTGRLPNLFAFQPNAMLPCKDGWVVIATPFGEHWNRFVEMLGNPEWASLEVFADGRQRGANWDALKPLIKEWTIEHTGDEIMRLTQERSIPCFPAFTVKNMAESEQTAERDFLWSIPVEGMAITIPGPPFKLKETPHKLRSLPPKLGQHNKDLKSLSEPLSREEPRPHLDPQMPMPLSGIRVLDLGQVVSIPHCGRLLAWMGADVIHIESSARLTTRNNPPFAYDRPGPNTSGMYNALGSGKRSCTLNLTTPDGVELFKRLVKMSDVVLENFAGRTMNRFGLGYETLSALNPQIVMVSLSAFGRTGPMQNYVGMHSAANLFSGVADVTGYDAHDRPRILGTVLPDPFSGTASCLAILEALYYRKKTGQGQHIDLSMSEAFANIIPEAFTEHSRTGVRLTPIGNRDAYSAPQGVYRCKGGDHWVAIAIDTEVEWAALCSVIEQPNLSTDPRFASKEARWENHDDLDTIIASWTRKHSHYEAMRLLQQSDIPAGAALDSKDLLNDPHLIARNQIVRTDHPEAGRHRMLGIPFKLGDLPRITYRPAPILGQDTDAILEELLEVSKDEIARLREKGVLT